MKNQCTALENELASQNVSITQLKCYRDELKGQNLALTQQLTEEQDSLKILKIDQDKKVDQLEGGAKKCAFILLHFSEKNVN